MYSISIGNTFILNVRDTEKGYDQDLEIVAECEWIDPISELLSQLIESVKDGSYEPFVTKNLDYEMRDGVIQNKVYWKLYPQAKRKHFKRYEGIDVDLFRFYQKQGMMEEKNATHFKRLNANQYCRYFCVAAASLGKHLLQDATYQEQYKHASDGRTLGLHQIDGDSYEAFDEWYSSIRGGFDHALEMRHSDDGSRVDLYIADDEDGYYLQIHANSACGMKVYLALAKEGVFANIFEPKSYLSHYNGTDYRSFYSEESCLGHEFPRTKKKAFIQAVKWEKLDLIQLKKKSSHQ